MHIIFQRYLRKRNTYQCVLEVSDGRISEKMKRRRQKSNDCRHQTAKEDRMKIHDSSLGESNLEKFQ